MITSYMYQSKYSDRFDFIKDYNKLVNRYYAKWLYPSFKSVYYNLDIENSVIDETQLVGGSYEMVGDLSGWRWRKVIDFDINGIEAVPTTPTTDERGVTWSEKLTTCYFPVIQGLVPQVHDFICFKEIDDNENYILRDPPLYEVVNIERSNDSDFCFYKVNLKVSYVAVSQVETQLSELLDYMDFEKKIYPIDPAIVLNKIMAEKSKNQINKLFDQNSGLYIEQMDC